MLSHHNTIGERQELRTLANDWNHLLSAFQPKGEILCTTRTIPAQLARF